MATLQENLQIAQIPKGYSRPQQQTLDQILQMASQGLQNPYAGFQPIAQDIQRQYQQNVVPGILERFNLTGGAASSPALARQLSQAGEGLQSTLAAQQAQFGQQNLQNLMNLLNIGLTPQNEVVYGPREQSFGEKFGPSLLANLAAIAPQLLGQYLQYRSGQQPQQNFTYGQGFGQLPQQTIPVGGNPNSGFFNTLGDLAPYIGGAVGSFVPGVGTGLGAALGGAAGQGFKYLGGR